MRQIDESVDIEGKPCGMMPFKVTTPNALAFKFVMFMSTAFIPPFLLTYYHMKPPG